MPRQRPPLRREISRATAIGIGKHGRDALPQERLSPRGFFPGQARRRVRMTVDETGCDIEPARIDDLLRRGTGQTPNRGNPVAHDGHVGPQPRRATAVEHPATPDQHIVSLGSRQQPQAKGRNDPHGSTETDTEGKHGRGSLPLWHSRRIDVDSRKRLPNTLSRTPNVSGAKKRPPPGCRVLVPDHRDLRSAFTGAPQSPRAWPAHS